MLVQLAIVKTEDPNTIFESDIESFEEANDTIKYLAKSSGNKFEDYAIVPLEEN